MPKEWIIEGRNSSPVGERSAAVSPTAALAAVEDAVRAAPDGDRMVRITDPAYDMRWLDIAVCEWGWALLYNDPDHGRSFGTWGGGHSATRLFMPPSNEAIELDHRWFVSPAAGRQALVRLLHTGRLWNGLEWWPSPPDALRIS